MRHKHVIGNHVRTVANTFRHVFLEHHGKFTAVFFGNAHLAVLYGNTGLELKQIRAKCCERGASATLVQKLQIVDHKGRVYARHKCTARLGDLGSIHAPLCHLAGSKDKKSTARRKIARVYHVHVFKRFGGKSGIIIGGRHLGTDGKKHHFTAIGGMLCKKIRKQCNVGG